MKCFFRHFICALIFILWSTTVRALDFPTLTGRVVDEAGVLTIGQRQFLETELAKTSHQVVAVTLKDLRGMEIEDYSIELARHWGIGYKDVNNGVLVIIAPNEHRIRIEVGYGLEGVLTDALAFQIVQNTMLPLAREGNYADALIRGSIKTLHIINQEPTSVQQQDNLWILGVYMLLVFLGGWIWHVIKWGCYQKSSKINKRLFVIDCVVTQLIFLFYIIVCTLYGAAFIGLILGLLLLSRDCKLYKIWMQHPQFPCRPEDWITPGIPPLGIGKGFGGHINFKGGGGHFGGGGSTGRW